MDRSFLTEYVPLREYDNYDERSVSLEAVPVAQLLFSCQGLILGITGTGLIDWGSSRQDSYTVDTCVTENNSGSYGTGTRVFTFWWLLPSPIHQNG